VKSSSYFKSCWLFPLRHLCGD